MFLAEKIDYALVRFGADNVEMENCVPAMMIYIPELYIFVDRGFGKQPYEVFIGREATVVYEQRAEELVGLDATVEIITVSDEFVKWARRYRTDSSDPTYLNDILDAERSEEFKFFLGRSL